MLIKLFTIDNVPRANRKRYSQASFWKMTIKYSLKKLTFDSAFREFIESQIQSNDQQILPLNLLHFERVAQLPVQHFSRYVGGNFGYIAGSSGFCNAARTTENRGDHFCAIPVKG